MRRTQPISFNLCDQLIGSRPLAFNIQLGWRAPAACECIRLEIGGTFTGRTTTVFALDAPAGSIVSIDLPRDTRPDHPDGYAERLASRIDIYRVKDTSLVWAPAYELRKLIA